jgi:hypothetical protein
MKMHKKVILFHKVLLGINKVRKKDAGFLPKKAFEIKKNYTFAA